MHLQLNNLSDRELLLRFRKFREREAAGALLDRYSHLMVAVCLPGLDAQHPAETVFPELTEKLYHQLSGATGRINGILYGLVQQYFGKSRVTGNSPALRDLESRVDMAGSNPIEKVALAGQLEKALGRLIPEDMELLQAFYLDHKPLRELAQSRHMNTSQVRDRLKGIRQTVATYMKEAAYE
ncbi:hypothetical protein [Chitinophaga sp.]|uniref:hypothetical protein n=1 Tax=Chitinophaga sp. TaxID=1869181 RepID=UPI002608099C|nr:hypothetical protein [uncultured Chitinophaga sp.]